MVKLSFQKLVWNLLTLSFIGTDSDCVGLDLQAWKSLTGVAAVEGGVQGSGAGPVQTV